LNENYTKKYIRKGVPFSLLCLFPDSLHSKRTKYPSILHVRLRVMKLTNCRSSRLTFWLLHATCCTLTAASSKLQVALLTLTPPNQVGFTSPQVVFFYWLFVGSEVLKTETNKCHTSNLFPILQWDLNSWFWIINLWNILDMFILVEYFVIQ